MISEGDTLYRYEDAAVPEIMGNRGSVTGYRVVKVTPCGAWVRPRFGDGTLGIRRRFMRTDGKRLWAHPTRSEALESYRARKQAQIAFLRARLHRAVECFRNTI